MAKLLLKYKADVNAEVYDRNTILILAIDTDNTEMVKLILRVMVLM